MKTVIYKLTPQVQAARCVQTINRRGFYEYKFAVDFLAKGNKMTDISKCKGNKDNKQCKTCYRFTAKSGYMQSWIEPRKEMPCPNYYRR